MTWIWALWLAMAAMCVTLAFVHGFVWLRQRHAAGNAAFTVLAISVAGMGYAEVRMMLAASPAEFGRFLWWYHLPVWSGLVAVVCIVRFYLRAGRAWLGWSAVALRTLALILNFFSTPSLQFREITSLDIVTVFGTPLAIARGVPNPWLAVAHAALLLLVIFLLDAMRDLWRRGDRRQAVVLTGSYALFVIAGTALALLTFWGLIPLPLFASLPFLLIVIVMAVELGLELINAARISDELHAKRAEVEHMSRVATLSELSGTLAHELNQPLGIIMSNAEAAQRMLESERVDVAELRDILDDIVRADERAGRVIERLRAMLRRRAPEREPVAVDTLVDGVLRFMRADIAARGVAVERPSAGAGARVLADRVALEQVLVNLLGNACDAMASTPAGERVVTVDIDAGPRSVAVAVSDRGHGLPDPPDRIFEPFYSTKPEGLGMGLAIARSIVTAHGGRIGAARNARGGATVRMELPALESGAA
ncbi:MAG: ATP-binding protein [Burkholderiales bacterium]